MTIESFIVGGGVLAAVLIAGVSLRRQRARLRVDGKALLEAREADDELSEPQPPLPPPTKEADDVGSVALAAESTEETEARGQAMAAALRGSVNPLRGSAPRSSTSPLNRALHAHLFAGLKGLGSRAKP